MLQALAREPLPLTPSILCKEGLVIFYNERNNIDSDPGEFPPPPKKPTQYFLDMAVGDSDLAAPDCGCVERYHSIWMLCLAERDLLAANWRVRFLLLSDPNG